MQFLFVVCDRLPGVDTYIQTQAPGKCPRSMASAVFAAGQVLGCYLRFLYSQADWEHMHARHGLGRPCSCA